jgi:hypothetical protein
MNSWVTIATVQAATMIRAIHASLHHIIQIQKEEMIRFVKQERENVDR